MKLVAIAVVCAFLVFSSNLGAQNLIVNGSFEEPRISNGAWLVGPVPGWTISGLGQGEIQRGLLGMTAAHGKQWMELDVHSNVTISQSFPTVPGVRYRYLFRDASRPGDTGSQIEVFWNGASQGFTTPTSSTFRIVSGEIVATSAVSTISFKGGGPSNGEGDMIDGVEVFAIDGAGSLFGYKYFVPQIAAGGGWLTSLMVTGEAAMNYMYTTYNDAGTVMSRPGVSVLTTNRSAMISLGEGGSAITTGWVVVETSAPANVTAIFRERVASRPDFEASVPARAAAHSITGIFDNTSGFSTGMAVANPNSRTVRLNVTLWNSSGTLLRTATLDVPAMGHTSFFLKTLWSQTANTFGRIAIEAVDAVTGVDSTFVPVGLRFSPAGAFTTIPY